METVKWTHDLSVGDEAIDDDHKDLFQLVEELDHANMSHDYINLILDRLKRYTKEHFSREEEYMLACGYPGLAEHQQRHAEFNEWLETIRSTYARFPQSPFIIGDSVNSYLNRWWRQHILSEDMKYRDFILAQKKA
ncbi:bacteriohemerythrin [Neptuniibacter halophilus]|uniref:bacteriohemerythrin n=1 Tax=Neptuniibacter halophilus TaxID=651666 RepID=UPI00257410A7|nr:hemerythrin family protein [Neptuniibacter halophilus]